MGYKITIEKTEEKTIIERGDYQVIDERPYSDEEVNNMNQRDQRDFRERAPEQGILIKKIYGYPEDKTTIKQYTKKVFEQEVDELDVASVIKAINGLT
jgi:hypothetical protein